MVGKVRPLPIHLFAASQLYTDYIDDFIVDDRAEEDRAGEVRLATRAMQRAVPRTSERTTADPLIAANPYISPTTTKGMRVLVWDARERCVVCFGASCGARLTEFDEGIRY